MTPPARDERRWTLCNFDVRGPLTPAGEEVEVMPVSEHEAALAAARQMDEASVDRLAVYFLNEYRAITDLDPVESLDFLSDFAQEDWRAKARAALLAALTPEPEDHDA